jgi:hypothetical protein
MRTLPFLSSLTAFVLSLFLATSAVADPPTSPKHHWRNRNDYKHYFLYERATNTWVETIHCNPVYRFKRTGGDLNTLYLYDAGRKLTVKLNYDGMWLKFDHEANYAFYQYGTFDKRVRFFHQYNGQWTGTLSRLHGCNWEELLAGGSAPSFRFKAYAEDANAVLLHDASRNMRVRLNAADMWLQPNGQSSFSFFKGGYWSEY